MNYTTLVNKQNSLKFYKKCMKIIMKQKMSKKKLKLMKIINLLFKIARLKI